MLTVLNPIQLSAGIRCQGLPEEAQICTLCRKAVEDVGHVQTQCTQLAIWSILDPRLDNAGSDHRLQCAPSRTMFWDHYMVIFSCLSNTSESLSIACPTQQSTRKSLMSTTLGSSHHFSIQYLYNTRDKEIKARSARLKGPFTASCGTMYPPDVPVVYVDSSSVQSKAPGGSGPTVHY